MALKLKEMSIEDRPRERLVSKGPSSLSNAELLAVIIGTGTKEHNVIDLSTRIMSMYDIESLATNDVLEIQKVAGIGMAKSCQISAAFELARRLSQGKPDKRCISSSRDIYEMLRFETAYLKKEHLIGIYLNKKNMIIKKETLFIGTLDSTVIHPREIFKSAISASAAGIILSHNHPSGDPSPSAEDIEVTRQIIDAGRIMGISLLDHVIVASGGFHSIRDELSELF